MVPDPPFLMKYPLSRTVSERFEKLSCGTSGNRLKKLAFVT